MIGERLILLQDQIIADYKDGQGCVVIARKFDISHTSVLNVLDQNGIDRNENKFARKTSEKVKLKIIEKYLEGLTLKEVGVMFNMDSANVSYILKNRNINRRAVNESRIIPFDKEFFNIKNEKSAYFYGFVLGDGSYGLKGKRVRIPNLTISVHNNDICILNQFCDWIKMDSSHIFHFKKSKMVRLDIRHGCVSNNKEYWGVIPNKTYEPIIPKIDDKALLSPFLIGLLDADGSVQFGNNKGSLISLVGNDQIMEWFIATIIKMGYVGNFKQYKYDGKIWSRVCFTNKKDVLQLAKLLRINEYDFILERKWNKLKAVIMKERVL